MERWSYEPAKDFGRPLGERLRSLQRESGFGGALARVCWWLLVRCYLALYHRLRITGGENLPRDTPFVLIANHSSHLDALTLAAGLSMTLSSRVFALAAGDTFFTTMPSSAFAAIFMNALPIWRSKTRRDHLTALRERLLGERCVYLLFPEGTRSRTGAMGRFKPGLGALVAGAEVPVVPCYIAGAHAAFPPDAWLPRPGKVSLTIGRPLVFADLANQPESWHQIAAVLESAVRELARDTPNINIRDARLDDAMAAATVLRRSITELCVADHRNDPVILARWAGSKTPELVASWINQEGNSLLLAVEGDTVLGVGSVTDAGLITLNYVSPDARFRGVSKALLRALEARALERGNRSCALTSTETALRFYKDAGYAEEGTATGNFGTTSGYPMTKRLVK